MIPTAPASSAGDAAAPGWDALLDAVARGDGLCAAYQPIVDTTRGSVVGFEALARFEGFAEKNPEAWFSAARARGRSAELEAAALRTALRARGSLPANCFLTVNVSPDLLSSADVRRVWREAGDLGGLVVELTEQTEIESYLALEPDLEQLRAAGALIAVDDAGAGYAGLRHLLALRPSMIKIDRELIRNVDQDEAKRALIEMLGTFASRVDAWILAEGVERVEELDTLVTLGVPLVQGYLLARPGPPWVEIDGNLAHRLAATHARRGPTPHAHLVRDIVEPATTTSSTAQAAALFAQDPGLRSVVIVDANARPLAVVEPQAAALDVAEAGLRINLDTPIAEALARAMTRPTSTRFEPLLTTDNAGRFTGLARLERMITVLATVGQPGSV